MLRLQDNQLDQPPGQSPAQGNAKKTTENNRFNPRSVPRRVPSRMRNIRAGAQSANCLRKIHRNNMKVYDNVIISYSEKKVFDQVQHGALWAVLEKHGIDTNIISCLKNLYANTDSAVRVDTNFKCSIGVRQGCVLSPMLFIACLKELVSRDTDQFDGYISIQGKQ